MSLAHASCITGKTCTLVVNLLLLLLLLTMSEHASYFICIKIKILFSFFFYRELKSGTSCIKELKSKCPQNNALIDAELVQLPLAMEELTLLCRDDSFYDGMLHVKHLLLFSCCISSLLSLVFFWGGGGTYIFTSFSNVTPKNSLSVNGHRI